MPRRQEYEDAAAKQRAYRERKRAELEEGRLPAHREPATEPFDEEQASRDFFGYASSETRSKAERDAAAQRMLDRPSAMISEEVYVKQIVELARLHHQQTSPDARDSTSTLEMRLARAEAYAHWRYRGFLAGEVASL